MKPFYVLFVVFALLLLAMPVAAAPAPVAAPQNGTDCPWGYPAYDSTSHTYVSQCSSGFVPAKAPAARPAVAKAAGLAAPVQVAARQNGTECPWGYPAYDATTHTYVSQCSSGFVPSR